MAGQSVEEEPDLPEEVTESLESFHEALGKVEDVFKPLLETSVDDLKEKMNPLQSAKLDLVVAYAINSMFWMYLTTQGVNPRQHPVKSELDRIKKYMGKVKEATEKKEASARIDKEAAKRFVKSALWEPSDKEKTSQSIGETSLKEDNEKTSQNEGETSPKEDKEKTSQNEGKTSPKEDSNKKPEKRKSEGKPSAKKKRKR